MNIFHDYAYVVNGQKRKQVVQLLHSPRTPTELAKLMKVHANVITRIIKDLMKRDLVREHELARKGKTYLLTKRGDQTRKILESLVEPRTLQELTKMLKAHRAILSTTIQQLIRHGFITIFKSLKPAKKFYQLTDKGEAVSKEIK